VSIAVSEKHYGFGSVVYKDAIEPHAELTAELNAFVMHVGEPAMIIKRRFEGQSSLKEMEHAEVPNKKGASDYHSLLLVYPGYAWVVCTICADFI
jgi:hypothetical protein